MLWDLNEAKHLYSLEAGDVVNALVFSPNRYWLCAATASCIKIFDLESKCVGLQPHTLEAILMFVIFSGLLSTSSSQNAPTQARLRSQSACRSPGQQMARHCLVVSPMNLSVSGVLSRDYFVGLVYYMTCCTLKIDRCCIHVRLPSRWTMRIISEFGNQTWEGHSMACRSNPMEFLLYFRIEEIYPSAASWRLRTRSSYVYLSIPPKSIVMAPVEMLTCSSHMCDTLALQLSPLSFLLDTRRMKRR
jgi:hypothetical protein